jgi:hypothetical protein
MTPGQTGRLIVGRKITLNLTYWYPETETSSINWAQLSKLRLEMDIESSLRNVVF